MIREAAPTSQPEETVPQSVEPAGRAGALPLSLAQRRLWFLLQLDATASLAYHVSAGMRLRGQLDSRGLKAALDRIVQRHDTLRTTFDTVDAEPVQVIGTVAESGIALMEHDLRSSARLEDDVRDCLRAEAREPFDLRRGPLIRARLIRCRADESVLLISAHHLICDGWSLGVLFEELGALYGADLRDGPDPLPALTIQYADYARWHRRWLSAERLGPQAQYWYRALSGAPERQALPTDRERPAGQSYAGARIEIVLDAELVRGLKALGARHGTTLFMTLLAGWAAVLSRLTSQPDVVIGTAVANRPRVELERLIGFLANTQALRIDLTGAQTGAELLQRVREQAISALSHADIPFEQIVEGVRPARTLSRSPLFQTMLSWRPPWHLRIPGLQVELVMPEAAGAPFDITLSVGEVQERIIVLAVYATALFDESTVIRYLEHWQALLRGLVADERSALHRIPLISECERRQLASWNATARPYPTEQCVHQQFEEQAACTPDAVALVCEGQQITYAELNGRANQLARHLIGLGVKPDVPVAICSRRSTEMVLGLLAILKAGGAYVPVDPAHPRDRVRWLLEDSKPALVLWHAEASSALREGLPIATVDLQADAAIWSSQSRADIPIASLGLRPDHLAYIIYTSGSTGEPKGVMNEHRAVMNRLHWMQKEYALGATDRVLQKTPFSFDVSVWEFFWPLLNGACLVVARPEGHQDPYYLGELIEQARISVIHFVPSMLRSFLDSGAAARCGSLRYVFCSGEELTALLQNHALRSLPHTGLHNLYGPTEAAIDVTYWACQPQSAETRVPIGRPIANTQIHVLDAHGAPAPIGAVGEICIAGAGVARGYWQRPLLTAERFVHDPVDGRSEARMYRTGDLGRWRADGVLEYLGRTDGQVKIHGFRIELGEIEAQLRRQPEISEAVVVAREDTSGARSLLAYVVARKDVEVKSLRERLRRVLPDYMVPAAYVRLAVLPVSANGKLDRQALPAPGPSAYPSQQYEAPVGDVEEVLAAIWQELLKAVRVGRGDNFFELGGHSLLALILIERLRSRGLWMDLRALFTHADLAGLAAQVRVGGQGIKAPPSHIPLGCERIIPAMLPLIALEPWQIEQIVDSVPGGAGNVQDVYPLAPLQQGILFHHLMHPQGDPYVLSSLLAFDSAQALEDFTSALQAVIDRHDILRTALAWEGLPEPVQVVWRKAPLSVRRVSLRSDDGARELWERFDPRTFRIDIQRAPLFEAIEAHETSRNRWLLLLLFHHLATDHTSLEVIFEEVRAHLHGRQRELPPSVPFRNFVTQALRAVPLGEHEAFFRAMLGGIEEPTAPLGLLDARGDGSDILEFQHEVDAGLARAIRACAREHRVSAASLFHLAWAQVLARLTGHDSVVFGTVLFGRMQAGAGADRALGLFINTLPIRICVGQESAQEALHATHERLAQLMRHEHASLVTAQRCSAVASPAPLFTALLNYRYSQAPTFAEVNGRTWQGMQVLRTEERSNYPIALSVDDRGGGFALNVQVRTALDPARFCRFMQRALEQLVRALTQRSREPLRSIDVLPQCESLQLQDWNATQAGYPHQRCIHELFEEHVVRTPDALAAEYEQQRITYAELNRRANQLGQELRERGIRADDRVALLVERGPQMLVGLLGILKAGAAYVPLDPAYPLEHLRYMLEDSSPVAVVTQEAVRDRLPAGSAAVLVLDDPKDAARLAARPMGNLHRAEIAPSSRNLAYVIYTSGSTGLPKGVMVEHRSVVNFLTSMARTYELGPADALLALTTLSFDIAVLEIFLPLISGARVVLASRTDAANAEVLAQTIRRCSVTLMQATPVTWRMLLDGGWPGAARLRALCGGEALTADLSKRLARCVGEVWNLYGPTETTIWSTCRCIDPSEAGPSPIESIGRPIANTRIYILDQHGQPVPMGVMGEIYIGGAGVARGYLNREELTAERFLRDPFCGDEEDGKMYRTGDLGRWRTDGTIEFLGRNDFQVKVRGYRIELGEIEARLRQCAGVREAVVLAREDDPGEKRLVAYVTARDDEELQVGWLREQMLRRLPEYMVPALYVQLGALPLTANGKLNRRALPAPKVGAAAMGEYERPHGELEQALASIWQEVLRVERVGRADNFFALGGHSLLATRVMAQVRAVLGLELPLLAIFEAPSLRELAERTEQLLRGAAAAARELLPQAG